jgi:hypothetical protein
MNQDDDIKKLRVLLPHWINHNMEHAAEFRTWSLRADEAEDNLRSAADHLVMANRDLEEALKHLGGSLDVKDTA